MATFLERNPRPNSETALRIAKEIALGVEELHECGIIHGSLRPSNVMVRASQLHAHPFPPYLNNLSSSTRHSLTANNMFVLLTTASNM